MAAGTSGKKNKSVVDKRVTWAQMVRDVIVAGMDKGQLLPVGLLLWALLMTAKMPSDQVMPLFDRLMNLIRSHEVIGYGLWLITVMGWYFHTKYMRANHNEESGRIGREKSRLQEQLSGRDLPSSRRN